MLITLYEFSFWAHDLLVSRSLAHWKTGMPLAFGISSKFYHTLTGRTFTKSKRILLEREVVSATRTRLLFVA